MTQTRHCLALLLLAAGCAPVETWHKPGETAAGRAADLTACRVAAVQSVPANTQIGRTPVRVTPPRQRCVRAGDRVQCLTTPGQVYGGQSYSYDANAGLRADVVTQCMATRGYRAVRLPACRGAAAEGPIRDSGMPALTAASCAVKTRGGAVIVTPS